MTTIKSGHIDTIEVDVKLGRPHQQMPREGEVWLDVILAHNGETVHANVPTTELLAALDAVPREDFDKAVALSEERQSALEEYEAEKDGAWAEVRRLTAERDELAATIERVREVCTELAKHGSRTAAQMEKIRTALDPKPAFVLPTEPGARFEARFNDGDPEEFTAWTDGTEFLYKGYAGWNDAARFANGGWHDFRLLDGAA